MPEEKAPPAQLLKLPPSIYIPTLYFIEGLPYTIVTAMAVVWFKNLGLDNDFVGKATSMLALPWAFKPLWAPLVDTFGTRRSWIVILHVVLSVFCGLLAASSFSSSSIVLIVAVFAVVAIASATQDIAIDGYYMDVLAKDKQAVFVGFRNAAYKVAWLMGSGGLVYLAGLVAEKHGMALGWGTAFGACSAMLLLAAALHSVALPYPAEPHLVEKANTTANLLGKQFRTIFFSFFTQPRALIIVLYILTFRLGDALMLKMAQPFLLDPRESGGLGISTKDIGLIYGTVGTFFLLLGGIAGSFIVARFTLKKSLMPTAIFQCAAILLYWALAVFKPSLPVVACVNAIEQFSYGLGSAAYTVYLLSTVRPEYKASHYAIATGLMAIGLQGPGFVSGKLTQLGYPTFFLISFLVAIPGIITILFLPFKEDNEGQTT